MRIGTTAVVYTLRYPIEQVMERIAAAGFDSVDLNLYSFCGKDHNAMDSFPMAEDGWRDWARYVGECAEKAGVVVGQIKQPERLVEIAALFIL